MKGGQTRRVRVNVGPPGKAALRAVMMQQALPAGARAGTIRPLVEDARCALPNP